MRISTQQVYLKNVDNLTKANADLFHTQQQLSTGKKVIQPSDDPLASAQIQKFKKEIARTEQFSENIAVSERRLALEENTIDQINNLSIRLKELTIQGKNGILNNTDRVSVAAEVGEIIKELEGLMNTKDVQGEYLFAGNKGFTKPYTYDAETERYVFNGDDGQRLIQVGPENKIASTDSGFEIFEKLAKVPGYVIADMSQTDGRLGDVTFTDAEAFDNFVTANGPVQFTFENGKFSITDSSRPPQPVTGDIPAGELTNITVQAGDTITFQGVKVTIEDTTDGTVQLDAISQHNILNTALDLKNALETSDVSDATSMAEFNEKMDHILANLSSVEEKNIQIRASIGGRMNALEQQDLVNEDYKLFTTEALSSFEDLDYNEAISRFQLQQTVLQASYASFSKVGELSLFNFI